MTIIKSTDEYDVDQIPIERVNIDDFLLNTTPDGKPLIWQVYAKRIHIDKEAGISTVSLQGEPKPGDELVPEASAPFGTLTHRIITKS